MRRVFLLGLLASPFALPREAAAISELGFPRQGTAARPRTAAGTATPRTARRRRPANPAATPPANVQR